MNKKFKTALLINPPGPLYQRGEDRSQGDVEHSSATSLRAPNDLAYMAGMLRRIGVVPQIKDYPAEELSWTDFKNNLQQSNPDILIMSITNATILDDVQAFKIAKAFNPNICTIAKGALFYACDVHLFQHPDFHTMDFALVGEAETIINDLVLGLEQNQDYASIGGIIYKDDRGNWVRTKPKPFETHLDMIPFPARDLLKNELYVRPDTGEAQATIQTARGCPSKCVFCLTPTISGQRVRQRSIKNVVDEIEECVNVYHIKDFFFKADTFTINKKYIVDICQEIIKRKLDIHWVANSRVDSIDEERLQWMKRAGCWLVAFGFESGNDGILEKMKKDATVVDAVRAVQLVKKTGLRIYGFFLIGLPWDNHQTIQETLSFAKELDCDFSEIHIATPYEGTELHSIAKELGLIEEQVVGHNYFSDPVMGSLFVSREEILAYRKKGIKSLYLSPKYVLRTISQIRTPTEFVNYASYGMRIVKNLLIS